MSAQFALDPALPNSPNTENKPNQSSYSILPAYPPLPGWGPFPGLMFAPPGVAPPPMPMYMAPPTWAHPNPNQPQPQVQQPAQAQAAPQSQSTQTPAPKPRPKRADPPPINPQATASPHYQNPGGLGGVYTPPTQNAPASTSTPGSHYTHKPAPHPLSDLGRPFACGLAGCSAAFDRKSDCERHRRTHVKSGNDSRPFRCSREGCEAAFDRKDALMRHERNERTHLVRQTQPGNRIKKPTDTPRRMSSRKRKAVNMFLDASEDDDEGDHKRSRADCMSEERLGQLTRVGSLGEGPSGLSDGGEELATNMEDMVVIPDEQLVIDPALHALESASTHGLGSSLGPTSSGHSLGSTSHGLDPGSHGLDSTSHEAFELGVQPGEVETMQAVEAIQAALQQIEADVDAERGA